MKFKKHTSVFIKKEALFALLLFALIFVRYCYYGFEYYHQLDDYIQYHNYIQGGNRAEMLTSLGLLAARPLAGCLDLFFWSHFFDRMILSVAIISAMLSVSVCLLRRVWSRRFETGYVFVTVFALLPLGIEGTYWVSASSRVVTGLFFASLALYFFERWCSEGTKAYLFLYSLSQLVSFGFYEQVLVFSVTSVLITAAIHLKTNKYRASVGLISFINAGVYFGFTALFKGGGVYGNRLGIITSYGRYYFKVIFPDIINQIRDAFLKGGFYTLVKGAYRGARIIIADRNMLYAITIITLSAGLFIFANKNNLPAGNASKNELSEETAVTEPDKQAAETAVTPEENLSNTAQGIKNRKILFHINALGSPYITGILLALAPVSIFFVLESAWFSLRGTVMSFCGFAIIADSLVSQLTKKIKCGGKLTAFIVSGFALLCCVASVSTIHDYKQTTAKDREIVEMLAERFEADGRLNPDLKIAVLNVEASYLPDQNYYFHEHIHGVTESGWALTGMLEWRVGLSRPNVTPMPKNPAYRQWNKDASKLKDFDAVYILLETGLSEVEAVNTGETDYSLYAVSGEYIGRLFEKDGCGYLELYKSSNPSDPPKLSSSIERLGET